MLLMYGVFAVHCLDSVRRRQHITYVVMIATPFGLRILQRGRHGRRRWQIRSRSSKQLQKLAEASDLAYLNRLVPRFSLFQYIKLLPSTKRY